MEERKFRQFKIVLFIIIAAIGAALILYYSGVFNKPAQNSGAPQNSGQQAETKQGPSTSTPPTSTRSGIAAPITNWQARATKKPFGIYITPQNSPVQPEKFFGYHTGVDFETFLDEQNIDVPIYAVCDGKLLQKRTATGYGGIAVLACKLNGQDVTIIYGHVRLSSVSVNVGDLLKAGDKLAVLGTGFSVENDGERKHLHLGIHKGTAINILGYAQNQAELSNWIDVIKYLK